MGQFNLEFMIANLRNKKSSGYQLHEEELVILQLADKVEILRAKIEVKEFHQN